MPLQEDVMAQAPLTREAFFGTFRVYHEAFVAAPFIWVAIALAMLYLAIRPHGRSDRMIGLFLAGLWAWAGIAYFIMSHAPVNPAAYLFGALFVVQAIVFLHVGTIRHRLSFDPRWDAYGITGAILMGYALILYPVIGLATGHVFPETPTFGVPCPTTIFTLGLLLWTAGRVPGWVLAIPVAWGLIGAVAALNWGIWQDVAMPVAAIIVSVMLLRRNQIHPLSVEERTEQEEIAALAGVG
jgi:hypothetical protein